MRQIVRPLATAFGLAVMAAVLSGSGAFAQAKQAPKQAPAAAAKQQATPPPAPAPPKQMALTEKQIEGVLAAQPEIEKITEKIQPSAKPDPKIDAQLDAVAKKNGFGSYAEYD